MRRKRGHMGHTHSYTSCLLMSLKPEIVRRKQMAVHPCRLEDWFANELFEEIAEDSGVFIRTGEEARANRNRKINLKGTETKYQKKNEMQKRTRQKAKQGAAGGKAGLAVKSKSIQSWLVMKIQSVTLMRSFIGYESFRTPSAPQAKVNT